jgi:hypothetical protein
MPLGKMVKKLPYIFALVTIGLGVLTFLFLPNPGSSRLSVSVIDQALAAQFNYLSTHGTSTCSGAFLNSIPNMPDGFMLQGSCCSPMDFDTYVNQTNYLKIYKNLPQIPSDPYNISAQLAKELLNYDKNITSSSPEQQILNTALSNTKEKGYCCCRCWRWYVYEGLSKQLVRNNHFTSQQITDLLNNSDGCGGK